MTDVMCQHAVMVMAVLVSLSLMTQDSVIFERLQSRDPFKEVTEKVLQQFAEEGLRTLCLAELDLTEDVYRVHGRGKGRKGEGHSFVRSVWYSICFTLVRLPVQRWNAEYEDASLILNQKEKRKQLDRLAEQIEKVQQGLVHPMFVVQ